MKPLSTLFFIFSLLLALTAFAGVVFVATFDANQYKTQISQLVKKNTGRDLHLKGDIKLSLYPSIALNLGAASFSNPEGFGKKPFATVKSAKISVQLIPLLTKKLVVEKIQLERLQLDLHKKADGRTNWDSLTGNAEPKKEGSQFADELLKNLSIAGVELNNAIIQWQDDAKQQSIVIAPLNISTGVFRPNQPISLHLQGVLNQQNSALSLSGDLTTTVTLTQNNQHINLQNTRLNATASGLPFSNINLLGDIKGTQKQLTIAGLKLHLVADKSVLPKGRLALDLTGDTTLDIEQQRVQIPTMQLHTTLTELPHADAVIKATIKGNATATPQVVHITGMDVNATLQNTIAKTSHSSLQLNGDTQLDIKTLLLTIKNMALTANASNIFENAGTATTQVTGDLRANLKDSRVNINAMTADLTAKNVPKIGDIKTTIAGNLSAKIKHQQMTLQPANIKTQIKGDILSGGHLYGQLSSTHLFANAQTQHIKLQGMKLNATVNGGIVPSGKLVHSAQGEVDINLSSKKGTAQLTNILLEVAGAKLTGSAKLTRLSPQPTVTGVFKTNSFNLKQVLTAMGIDLPVTRKATAFGQSRASFQLTATPTALNLQRVNARMDQSNITGDIAISHFQHPTIKTKLMINQLVVDDYLAPVHPNQAAKKSNPKDKLLPVKMLKALHLTGSIDIKKLRIDAVDLTHVHANLHANKGIINAKPLRFQAFKGHYNGALTINVTGKTPLIAMQHKIQQVRSENVLLQFYQDRYVSGGIYLNTQLTTRGNTLATLKQNLQGNADIEFRKGTIRDSNLAKKIALAIDLFEKRKTNAKGQNEVTFTKLAGNWKANRGVFTTDNMQLLSPHFLITGKGAINIVNNQLDLKLRLRPKDKHSKLFAPLHIHGPFDKLKYELELDVLVKSLLKEDLYQKKEALKQKLLDEKAKVLDKLEARKQAELQKLHDKKEQAQQRLKEEQEKLQQRLKNEQLKAQQRLQDKLKQEQEKLQQKLNERLTGTLSDQANEAVGNAADDIQKKIEEETKDKLKDALKGLF